MRVVAFGPSSGGRRGCTGGCKAREADDLIDGEGDDAEQEEAFDLDGVAHALGTSRDRTWYSSPEGDFRRT